ncbi:MAG: carboxymuconolactone decarboxylase family protein [Planctomycetota bacterium]
MFDDRLTELVAVGASVAANCHPCVKYHVSKAQEIGIAEEDIKEALSVGKMVREGAARKMDEFVSGLF